MSIENHFCVVFLAEQLVSSLIAIFFFAFFCDDVSLIFVIRYFWVCHSYPTMFKHFIEN